MTTEKEHTLFFNGPIPAELIARQVSAHSVKTDIGAHDIFLGQVRADVSKSGTVRAITYSAYEALASERYQVMREEAITRFGLRCAHVLHSLGEVKAGEICLFVFVSASHREAAFEGCCWLVEQVKKDLPVWGKLIFGNDTHEWKQNTMSHD
jgi:molybdopterin synthase catalytic subunit